MVNLPDRIATSPLTLACPLCHVQPGELCELYVGEDENFHVERIWVAVKMDNAEQDRLNRLRIAVQRWNVYPISVPGENTKASPDSI
jgi:hypothetical protein